MSVDLRRLSLRYWMPAMNPFILRAELSSITIALYFNTVDQIREAKVNVDCLLARELVQVCFAEEKKSRKSSLEPSDAKSVIIYSCEANFYNPVYHHTVKHFKSVKRQLEDYLCFNLQTKVKKVDLTTMTCLSQLFFVSC